MKAWQSLALWQRVLIGLVIGLAIGVALHYGWPGQSIETDGVITQSYNGSQFASDWIYPFGDAFVRLIKMLVIPLITTTLVAGITAMGDPRRLGSLGAKTLMMYMLTTFFAVTLGLVFGTLIKPGVGIEYANAGESAIESIEGKLEKGSISIVDQLLEIIPVNPVAALAEGKVLPTIFFAILIGIGILLAGQAGDPVRRFFDSAAEVLSLIHI